MTYRILIFFLLLTACAKTDLPEEPSLPSLIQVEQEPWPEGWSEYELRDITTPAGRFLAGSAAVVASHMLSGARPQVQWLQSEEARFRQQFVRVIPAPGVMLSDSRSMTAFLSQLGARLVPTDTTTHLLYLRHEALTEDIVLTNTAFPGPLSAAESKEVLAENGIHLVNETGHELRVHPDAIDIYFPALQDYFGDSLATMRFYVTADTLAGVRLIAAD